MTDFSKKNKNNLKFCPKKLFRTILTSGCENSAKGERTETICYVLNRRFHKKNMTIIQSKNDDDLFKINEE